MTERFELRYGIRETRLGRLLVAATPAGLCFVRFGEDEAELCAALRDEFPFAEATRGDDRVRTLADALIDFVEGRVARLDVPLDVRGSRFQRRVWKEVASIARGETRSYRDVARAVGMPTGARAVARACAANPVPIAIPCHRVVNADGRPGGYNGGVARKLRLLALEGAVVNVDRYPGRVAPGQSGSRSAPHCQHE